MDFSTDEQLNNIIEDAKKNLKNSSPAERMIRLGLIIYMEEDPDQKYIDDYLDYIDEDHHDNILKGLSGDSELDDVIALGDHGEQFGESYMNAMNGNGAIEEHRDNMADMYSDFLSSEVSKETIYDIVDLSLNPVRMLEITNPMSVVGMEEALNH